MQNYSYSLNTLPLLIGLIFLALALCAPMHASADDGEDSILANIDMSIQLTPDKSKIVRLERDAASVVVANPAHASVFLDTPRVAVVIPREPGATTFMVLDAAGRVITERNIIVTGRKQNYIRIHRACGADMEGCQMQTVYYCPNGCHEVRTVSANARNDATVSDETPALPGQNTDPALSEDMIE